MLVSLTAMKMLLTLANGYGVVEDHRSGEQIHVKMFRMGLGPGLSIKGHHVLAVIKDERLLTEFRTGRWTFGGYAEASFKFGDTGGGVSGIALVGGAMDVYLWTHTGFALEAAFGTARIWPNASLNMPR